MNEPSTTPNREVPLHVLLRERRIELGLRQAEIAESLNVTAEAVTLWERGRRRMELGKFPRIAATLELDAKELCARALAEYHPGFFATLFGNAGAAAVAR